MIIVQKDKRNGQFTSEYRQEHVFNGVGCI